MLIDILNKAKKEQSDPFVSRLTLYEARLTCCSLAFKNSLFASRHPILCLAMQFKPQIPNDDPYIPYGSAIVTINSDSYVVKVSIANILILENQHEEEDVELSFQDLNLSQCTP